MKERRTYTRFDLDGRVLLKPEVNPSGVIQADLCDLSFIGVSMSAQERLDPGTRVNFEISTRLYNLPICGVGDITYLQETKKVSLNRFRLGMRFVDIDKHAITSVLTSIQREINLNVRRNKLR